MSISGRRMQRRAIAAGDFSTTAAGKIIDPNGQEFWPMGANLGTQACFDWRGTADGRSDSVLAWGWNTVRLNMLVTSDISWSYVAQHGYSAFLQYIDSLVTEYTGKHIVTMLASHDLLMNGGGEAGTGASYFPAIASFWSDMATAYKNNPYVWFNLHNEPPVADNDWVQVHQGILGTIRGVGANNIVVCDAPTWGQDLGPQNGGSKFMYDATMAPTLAISHGNVVASQHNYGGYSMYTSVANLQAYYAQLHSAGLPILHGEFGYTIDGSSTAGGYQINYDAAQAIFQTAKQSKVGALWWHATHGDNYSLKLSGNAFYDDGGPGLNLSDGGTKMWSLTH